MATAPQTKNRRIEVRATERQEAPVRQAAAASSQTIASFVLSSAVERAERVLAKRRWFTGSPGEHQAFLRLLDEPLPSTVAFEKLWSRPSPFRQPFTPNAQ